MGRGKGKTPAKQSGSVRLPKETWDHLKRIGDGNTTRGIEIVCQFYAEHLEQPEHHNNVKEPAQGFTDATWDFLRHMGDGSCNRGFEAVSRYFANQYDGAEELRRVPIASGPCI